MFKAHCFKFLDDLKSFMGVQVLLAFSSHKSTGGVNNDATSSESRSIGSALTGEGDSLGCADKMVHKNGLAWEQFVLLEHWGLVGDLSAAWLGLGASGSLLPKLTSCAHGWMAEPAGSGVEGSLALGAAEDASAHQEGDLVKSNVSQPLVPTQELLLRFTQVDVLR